MEMHQLKRRRRPIVEELESRRLLAIMSLYSLPAGITPGDMVSGPDGNLWFVNGGPTGTEIGMFNPTTQASTEFPLPGGAGNSGIAVGPDGNIWFADSGANAVGTINLTTRAMTEFPVPTPDAGVDAMTAGPDGNLWFIEWNADKLGSINPTTHAISEFSLPTSFDPAGPYDPDLTAGPDGNLWLTSSYSGPGINYNIATFNLTTDESSVFSVPGGYLATDITSGPDGDLWFTASTAIGTINPTTDAISMFPLPPNSGSDLSYNYPNPIGITTGPDGNIWFANSFGYSIGMINPTTDAITEFPVPNAPPNNVCCYQGPYAIVAGSNDTVWFDSSDQIGEINLSPPDAASTGSPGGTGPVTTTVPNAPPAPGLQFGFTIGLTSGSAPAATQQDETINLALGNTPASGGDALSVTTTKGVTAISGLTLRRFDHGAGYRIVASQGASVTTPHGSRKVAIPRLLATEKVLTAGQGKNEHVVGFRVVLSKSFEPAVARDMTERTAAIAGGKRSRSVGLQVSYQAPAGTGSLVLYGKAKVASTGQIVVVAKIY